MKGVCRARFEIEPLVPTARILIFCVNDQRSNSGDIRSLCCSQQGIFEKRLTDARSLVDTVDRQSGEYHHGNWMARHSLEGARRGIFALHRSDREAVIANDAPGTAGYVCLRSVGSLVSQRESFQKAIEVVLSTVERIGFIVGVQLMD